MSVKLKVGLTHSRRYSLFSTQELWCSVNKASMEPQDKTGNRIWAPQDFFFFFLRLWLNLKAQGLKCKSCIFQALPASQAIASLQKSYSR